MKINSFRLGEAHFTGTRDINEFNYAYLEPLSFVNSFSIKNGNFANCLPISKSAWNLHVYHKIKNWYVFLNKLVSRKFNTLRYLVARNILKIELLKKERK